MIWLHQTRPDIGFDITKLATGIVQACADPTQARATIALCNKTVRFVNNYHRDIVYTAPPECKDSQLNQSSQFARRRLIVPTDAGVGPLAQSHSAEGAAAVLDQVADRDGVIHFHGYMIDRRCAEIQRACKSSLAAEAHAALTAADQALRFQVSPTGIVTWKYDITAISPPAVYPLPDHFGHSPTDKEVTSKIQSSPLDQQTHFIKRQPCQTSQNVHQLILVSQKEWLRRRRGGIPETLFRPLLRTDCCSLFSAILRIQPMSQDK